MAGLPPLDVAAAAEYVAKLATERDLVIVEGAGGLLVRYDQAGSTLADLAVALGAPVLVVVAAGLGTLNHTVLTCEALSRARPGVRGRRRRQLAAPAWTRRAGEPGRPAGGRRRATGWLAARRGRRPAAT